MAESDNEELDNEVRLDAALPGAAGAPEPGRFSPEDRAWMGLALDEARTAAAADEVPIGALIVRDGHVLARAHNATRAGADPTAHAEMIALRRAAAATGDARLVGATIYCSVEPCFMCAGALVHARVARVVFAVRDPKFGAAVSLGTVLTDPRANHRVALEEGLLADDSRAAPAGVLSRHSGAPREGWRALTPLNGISR